MAFIHETELASFAQPVFHKSSSSSFFALFREPFLGPRVLMKLKFEENNLLSISNCQILSVQPLLMAHAFLAFRLMFDVSLSCPPPLFSPLLN